MGNIDALKIEGRYREAGAAAFRHNPNFRFYGCHFGMRSERDFAMREFYAGFDDAARAPKAAPASLDNIAKAFIDIAEEVHDMADDIASEAGRDYDAVRARLGQSNIFFRQAMEELSWQASEASRQPVDPSFEIEF